MVPAIIGLRDLPSLAMLVQRRVRAVLLMTAVAHLH